LNKRIKILPATIAFQSIKYMDDFPSCRLRLLAALPSAIIGKPFSGIQMGAGLNKDPRSRQKYHLQSLLNP
jgi:hypothetical protein